MEKANRLVFGIAAEGFDLFRCSPYEHDETAESVITVLVEGEVQTVETAQTAPSHMTSIPSTPAWLEMAVQGVSPFSEE